MIFLLFLGCAHTVALGELPSCGAAPHCVVSRGANRDREVIDPLPLRPISELEHAVVTLPGCVVTDRSPLGLLAYCTTPSGLFTDDMVLVVGPEAVDVWSSSRFGWTDMGVNRQRVEDLRDVLAQD